MGMESLLPEREGDGYSRRQAGIHPSVNKGRQGGTPYWLVVFGGHIYASMAGTCMLWHGAGHGSTTGPALPLIGRDVWLSWLVRSFQSSALTCHATVPFLLNCAVRHHGFIYGPVLWGLGRQETAFGREDHRAQDHRARHGP